MGANDGPRPNPRRLPPKRTLSDIPEPKTRSGLGGGISNMVNSIVGAGIIGIPYAFKESGMVTGLFLLVLVSYLTDKSLRIIIEAAKFHPKLKMANVQTFEDLMYLPFGYWGSVFVQANMVRTNPSFVVSLKKKLQLNAHSLPFFLTVDFGLRCHGSLPLDYQGRGPRHVWN
jgi:Transmembrane amino acid transporter protein